MKIIFKFNSEEHDVANTLYKNMKESLAPIKLKIIDFDIDAYAEVCDIDYHSSLGFSECAIQYNGLVKKSKEVEEAEKSVLKAKEALKAAEESLRVIKEKY